ncbi:MAG: UDP-N-acetylmuramate--L-alanine ligase [Actinobacteria bacterium]|nr:UDP-N-acetylmuramate--L-alanine ligase [Actinomycetota bacterium]
MSGRPAAVRWLTPAIRHVHLVGIGGKAMSAIAAALLDRGLQISGSDLQASRYTERLVARGARIHMGHAAANVAGADLVGHSAAVSSGNVELTAARAARIPVATRAQLIAELFNAKRGIAIAGTHGKTTTSGMVATILRHTGLDPSFLIGAAIPSLENENGHLTDSPWMVVEADEFDGAFLEYRPQIAVLTHLEPDHLDFFGSTEAMVEAFGRFAAGVEASGALIARADVPLLQGPVQRFGGSPTWFGPGAPWDIAGYQPGPVRCTIDLVTPQGPALVRTSLHGRHNAWNLVAAIAACVAAGAPLAESAAAATAYRGADRRLELRASAGGLTLLEDYAHHPTAARVTIAAAAEMPHRRLWAIYQPLLRSRTRDLFAWFADAFAGADLVILAEISSPPGREADSAISSADLAPTIHHPDVRFMPAFDQIVAAVQAEAVPGDVILVMGPESVAPLADALAAWIAARETG